MLKPTFLLLAFGLHGVASICFRNTTTTVRKEVIDRPEAIDEYHCKIICVERPQCLSFIYSESQCIFLGSQNHDGVCVKPYHEWIKKTADADCPDTIEQPAIDAGYVQNPALSVPGATQISTANFTFNAVMACPERAVMDATLPDNSNTKVRGSSNTGIYWDNKLGAWMLKVLDDSRKPIISFYIRSARCYDVVPSQFTATTSCGGPLPTRVVQTAGYKTMSPVLSYGSKKFCGNDNFLYTTDFRPTTEIIHDVYFSSLSCIDGSWIFLYGELRKPVVSTATILEGACATKF